MTKGEKIHLLSVSAATAILMDVCEKQGLNRDALKMEEQSLGVRIQHHGKHRLIVRCKEVVKNRNLAALVVRCVSGLADSDELRLISSEIRQGENLVIDDKEARFFLSLAQKKGSVGKSL